MTLDFYKKIILNAPFGYAYHKVIVDGNNEPIDYEYIEVNEAFEKLTGLNSDNIISKKITEIMPGIKTNEFNWIKFFGDVALNGGTKETEQYSLPLNSWYKVQVFSPQKYYFICIFTDVTNEKNKTDELNGFFSVNLDLLSIADLDGNFLKLNKAWQDVLGYSISELLSKKFLDFVHPDDVSHTIDAIKKLSNSEQVLNFTNRYRCKDGQYKFLEWRSNSKGNIIYSAARDITERNFYEKSIQDTKERLDLALYCAEAGLWDWDMINNTVYFSPLWKSMLGYTDEEIENDFSGWQKLWHPDDVEKINQSVDDHLKGKSKRYEVEHRLKHKNGEWRWILTRGDIIKNSENQPVRWIGTNIDITDKVRIEMELREERDLFSDGPVTTIIWAPNKNWDILYVSQNIVNILGYTPEEMKDKSFRYASLIHPDDFDRIGKEVQYNISNNINVYEQSYRLKLKNNEYHWFYDFTKLVRDENNNVITIRGYLFDQNYQKNMEKDLLIERQRLADIIKGTNVGTWEWNIETGETVFNERWADIIGYSLDELSPVSIETWAKYAHPDDFKKSTELLEKHFKGELRYYEFESRMKHKNGHWVWVFDRGKVSKWNHEGKPLVMSGTHQDITEKKQAEIELNKIKEQFELAINGTNDGIWDWDISTNKLFLSKRWKEMLGYKDNELKNEFSSFIDLVFEDDKKLLNDYITNYLTGNIRKYELEFRMKHKDGSLRWILAKGEALRDSEGKPYRMAGSHSDITDKKLSEKELKQNKYRLELAMDAGEHGFWDWNLETNETYFSPVYYTMLGYEDGELPMNLDTFNKLIHPDDKVAVMPEIQKSILEGSSYTAEFRLLCKDGSYRWISGKGKSYFKDETGKPIRAVGIHVDINDRKIAEEKMIEAKKQAESANKAKSEFLANMSHEIRTPLNGVIGFTDLLIKTPLSKIQKQYAENVNIAGHSLLGIINDILDFSKIEAGKLDLDFIKSDIIELTEESSDIVKFQASKKGLELLLDIQLDIPRFAVIDQVRLRQILINLLSNAVKFTDKGEVILKLSYSKLNNEKGLYTFSVSDTGIGITEEQKVKLFKAFSQADTSTTRKFGGTGLGLTISNMLAEKMGSKIEFTSKPGKGSVFSFTLETECEEGEKLDYTDISHIKDVLVVDDNKNNRMILEHIFKLWNINFSESSNGIEALKLIENKKFDVIIVDYNMPYFDGIKTIKMMRDKLNLSLEKQPVILLHSSSDDEYLYQQCKELGVRFNLHKPVKSNELLQYLKNINVPDSKSSIKNSVELQNVNKIAVDNYDPLILIAEDNVMNMTLAKIIIKDLLPHSEILEAKDGLEVLDIIKNSKPVLIFMDVQMPKMDGITAVKEIRKLENNTSNRIPVIALTAGALKDEEKRCREAGMDAFLTKPIDEEKIKGIIEKFLKENYIYSENSENNENSKNNENNENSGNNENNENDENNENNENNENDENNENNENNENIENIENSGGYNSHQDTFDKKRLLNRLKGNILSFKEIIKTSLSHIPSSLNDLENSIKNSDIGLIKKNAHTIKGASLNMSFNKLAKLSELLENNADKGSIKENIELFNKIELEWENVKSEILNELNT